MALEHGHLTALILPTLDLDHRKHHFYNLILPDFTSFQTIFFSHPLYFRTQAFGAKKRSQRSSPFLRHSRLSSITRDILPPFNINLQGMQSMAGPKMSPPQQRLIYQQNHLPFGFTAKPYSRDIPTSFLATTLQYLP